MTAIKLKWVYEPASPEDGRRILVDRLWPRGMTKERLDIVYWAKGVAPSNDLRKWYGHDPERWEEFRDRYYSELHANPDGLRDLLEHIGSGTVSFLYSSKEHRINNAVALRDYVQPLLRQGKRRVS
ncbi:DUF488 domain-containing protein [Noviherbaspirillum sp.]|uniref:DUF488 domain-containing protein n=1 Tax=Noviherbaspirillum sp. TaxID=1926288 RepID=UPI002D2D50DF|nr:DUF488 family protein [Noviherbaspirillum sp.]HZW21953.1 DUF488 family protein [Noviherbaspirillum sp.]